MLVTSIFSFSDNVFYSIRETFHHFGHLYQFVVYKCFQFEPELMILGNKTKWKTLWEKDKTLVTSLILSVLFLSKYYDKNSRRCISKIRLQDDSSLILILQLSASGFHIQRSYGPSFLHPLQVYLYNSCCNGPHHR